MSSRIEYHSDCVICASCGVVGVDLAPPPYPYYLFEAPASERRIYWNDEARGMLISEFLDGSTLEFLREREVP